MNLLKYKWVKPSLILAITGMFALILPTVPIDPWKILNLNRIATLMFALVTIQFLGTLMVRYLGDRKGSILTGFFGGLISSTATIASLARQSKTNKTEGIANDMLVFLSATLAMLLEAIVFVLLGTGKLYFSLLIVFIGPIVMTIILLYFYSSKSVETRKESKNNIDIQILPILKLTAFIIAILLLSKLLQNVFGQYGLLTLTFFVSLFEIHGSIIANVQQLESGAVGVQLLCSLLSLSVLASYISKIFLVATLGSLALKEEITKITMFLLVFLAVGWYASLKFA